MSRLADCLQSKFFSKKHVIALILFALTGIANPVLAQALPEAKSGELYFKDSAGALTRATQLQGHADIQISGMIAKVDLTQSFINTSDEWLEGIYVFPLPETAAVNHMAMHFGGRTIIGEIKEKNLAKKIYKEAKQSGKKASLVSQQRPNLFTQKVANIAPGETIAVTIHYLQKVDYASGQFSIHFPMTLTPRFIPGSTQVSDAEFYEIDGLGWAKPTDQVQDADQITPYMTQDSHDSNLFSLNIELNTGLPMASIDSLYHEIDIQKQANGHHINLRNSQVKMDRDFVLNWRPANGFAPEAAAFKETVNGEDYLLLMMLPPQKQITEQQLARDLIFIIDTSGSMGGTSIVQAKQSLDLALSRLKEDDYFNVIEFNSTHRNLYPSPRPATSDNIAKAKRWVSELQARGGTNMFPALHDAFQQMEEMQKLKQLVFITDGAVGNEAQLFQLINDQLGDSRLFTVSIGSAPNRFFMRKAAELGRGSFTHIGKVSEIKDKMESLFTKLESAIVSHIDIDWPAEVESYPERVPDLYFGEPVLVAAKMPTASGEVSISGVTAQNQWQRELNIELKAQSAGVASIWARSKIESIQDKLHRGMSEENVRNAILPLALEHSLLSAYTSFVAVEQEISRPQDKDLQTNAIPNLVAQSQNPQPQTLAYPQGATSSSLTLLLGFCSLGAWFAIYMSRRKSTDSK